MAENVRDGIDGLHFRVGDAGDLARVMRLAAGNRVLWNRLRAGCPEVEEIAANGERTLSLYTRAKAVRRTRAASP
jgi:hypothetical protein